MEIIVLILGIFGFCLLLDLISYAIGYLLMVKASGKLKTFGHGIYSRSLASFGIFQWNKGLKMDYRRMQRKIVTYCPDHKICIKCKYWTCPIYEELKEWEHNKTIENAKVKKGN